MKSRKRGRPKCENKPKTVVRNVCHVSISNKYGIKKNIIDYILDFNDLTDLVTLRKVSSEFNQNIKKRKSFELFIFALQENLKSKEKFEKSLFYGNTPLILVPSNENLTPSEFFFIEEHLFPLIFNFPLSLKLQDISNTGLKNLKVVINNKFSKITDFTITLGFIKLWFFKNTMKDLVKAMEENVSVRKLTLEGIFNGHVEYFQKILKNVNFNSLVLKVKKKKTVNLDFFTLLSESNITELELIGCFSNDDENQGFSEYFKTTEKLLSLNLSNSQGVVNTNFFNILKTHKSLTNLNLSEIELKEEDLASLNSAVKENSTLKQLSITQEKCANIKRLKEIRKKIKQNNKK